MLPISLHLCHLPFATAGPFDRRMNPNYWIIELIDLWKLIQISMSGPLGLVNLQKWIFQYIKLNY